MLELRMARPARPADRRQPDPPDPTPCATRYSGAGAHRGAQGRHEPLPNLHGDAPPGVSGAGAKLTVGGRSPTAPPRKWPDVLQGFSVPNRAAMVTGRVLGGGAALCPRVHGASRQPPSLRRRHPLRWSPCFLCGTIGHRLLPFGLPVGRTSGLRASGVTPVNRPWPLGAGPRFRLPPKPAGLTEACWC
jgi:hypothetical protein